MTNSACQSTRRDGTQCRETPTPSGHCFAHDSALQERTANGRRSGGFNKSNARRAAKTLPADMRALAAQLMQGISECHTGELDPKRLSAMGTAAGAVVRIHEVAETEQRLAALENVASVRKGYGL